MFYVERSFQLLSMYKWTKSMKVAGYKLFISASFFYIYLYNVIPVFIGFLRINCHLLNSSNMKSSVSSGEDSEYAPLSDCEPSDLTDNSGKYYIIYFFDVIFELYRLIMFVIKIF